MYTSLLVFALSVYSAPQGIVSGRNQWLPDYGVAYQRVEKEKKPLAVFVNNGPSGWNQLSREGRLSDETEEILRSGYICVYLDAAKEENRKLAASFDLSDNRGIILSDRTGSKQAFRAQTKLSNEDLARSLKKFAAPGVVVATTETPDRPPTPVYVPAPAIRVGC